jgi:hypothetical protein
MDFLGEGTSDLAPGESHGKTGLKETFGGVDAD